MLHLPEPQSRTATYFSTLQTCFNLPHQYFVFLELFTKDFRLLSSDSLLLRCFNPLVPIHSPPLVVQFTVIVHEKMSMNVTLTILEPFIRYDCRLFGCSNSTTRSNKLCPELPPSRVAMSKRPTKAGIIG